VHLVSFIKRAYLLLVSVLVHHHRGEELCHLFEKPATVMTLIPLVSLR